MAIQRPETAAFEFRHEVIDPDPPTSELVFCHATDLTGNGRPDVIVGGKGMRDNLWLRGGRTRFPDYRRLALERLGVRRGNVFWYENPGWERHRLADARRNEVGSAMGDIDGDGRLDLVAGQTVHREGMRWFHQPRDPRDPWPEYRVTDEFEMFHDVAVSDVDDDGEPEVVALSQESAVIFYYDVPDDPTTSPWPDDHRHVVAEDLAVEGVEVVDLDGDGRTEIVAGANVFHRVAADPPEWEREQIATGWEGIRVAVADLDDDGEREVVLAEGDSPAHGTHPGRVAWFDPSDWEPHFLAEELFCPHSLQIADFDGDGRPDIYVAEMGLGEHDDPRQFVFRNLGDGAFERHVVARGVPTHEASVVDLTGDGRPDVVGKSHAPDEQVDVWYNES